MLWQLGVLKQKIKNKIYSYFFRFSVKHETHGEEFGSSTKKSDGVFIDNKIIEGTFHRKRNSGIGILWTE